LLLLNKKCKYCPSCDLIIAKKQELESLIPQLSQSDYLVMGTLERQDWHQGNQGSLPPSEIANRMYIFKDIWDFEVIPAGWYPAED
jgi:ribosomal protein L11 methylase PrmA